MLIEFSNTRGLSPPIWRDLSCRQIFLPVTCSARIVTRADTWQFHASGLQRFPPPSLYDFFLPSSCCARSNMLYLPSIHPIPRCIIFIYTALAPFATDAVSIERSRLLSEDRSAVYCVYQDSDFPNQLFEIRIARH